MKESLWGYYLVFLGIIIIIVMILLSNIVTTNQQDYYLLKEVTNAAMQDSIDYSYYKKYGEMKINTEKFVEIFVRRFSESVSKNNSYKVDIYSVYENPPSVSIKVTSKSGEFNIAGNDTNIDVINSYDAILESNNNIFSDDCINGTCEDTFTFYSVPYGDCTDENKYIQYKKNGREMKYCKVTNKVPLQFSENSDVIKSIKKKVETYYKMKKIDKSFDINKVKISDVHYLSPMSTKEDIKNYQVKFKNTYNYIYNTGEVNKISYSNGAKEESYLAKNIDNVKITLVDSDDGKTFLAYGLDFNCDEVYKYGQENNKYDNVKRYRKKYTGNLENYLESSSEYISTEQYNAMSELAKEEYEWTPFYNSCLIGIKYKIDFYYDYS